MSRSSASALFEAIVAELDRAGARYLFARNYEGYPSRFTGDIDIYADLAKVRPALAHLSAAGAATGWRLLRTVDRPWVVVLQFVRREVQESRSVMVVEIFDRFTWLQFPYASFEQIWARRIDFNGLPALDQDLGMMVTVGHYLFWAGFLPEKYQAAIGEIQDRCGLSQVLTSVFGPSLAPNVERWLADYVRVTDDGWQVRTNIPERIVTAPSSLILRARLGVIAASARRSPTDTLRHLASLARIKLSEFFSLRGDLLLVDGLAWEVLKEVKQFHLYKNRNTIVVHGDAGHPLRFAAGLARLYWSLSRGGLGVLKVRDLGDPADMRVRVVTQLFGHHVKRLKRADVLASRLIDSIVTALS